MSVVGNANLEMIDLNNLNSEHGLIIRTLYVVSALAVALHKNPTTLSNLSSITKIQTNSSLIDLA